MDKILLLGGSAQQLVAIKVAKEMGYYTVLCDYLSDNPGQYVADKYYNASTTDIDRVYTIAKEEQVKGILAYASDPAALPAAIVAEKLGLPTNPSTSVEILGVKHKFREFLRTHGFACPQVYIFHPTQSIDEVKSGVKNFHFPIIVKPTDSSGSKGITKLNNTYNLEEAIHHADCYSRNKILIAEEFIERGFPDVIGGDIFVWNGQIVLHGEMACLRGDVGRSLIPIGEKKPYGLNIKQSQRVKNELQRIITQLNIQFGEMNVEILLDKKDDVHFLELGPRAGGNMIPVQLSDVFGVDLIKANVSAAMGVTPNLILNEKPGCFVTYVLHSPIDGKYKDVDYASEIIPYIYRKVVYKKVGDIVEAFDGASKAVGIVFLHFDTEEEMNSFTDKLEELIKVVLDK